MCETERADVLCSECQRMHAFCKCCFDLSHRSPKRKTHMPKSLQEETAKLSTDLSLQMYKCAAHPLEGRKYVCAECKTVACADCFAIGEHYKHNPKSFEEAAEEILGKFVEEFEDARRVHEKSKVVVSSVTAQREKEAAAYSSFANTIKEQFRQLHELLDKKMAGMLGIVGAEADRAQQSLTETGKAAGDILVRLEHRVKYLKESIDHIRKDINPDNYGKYKDLVPENLHELSEATLEGIRKELVVREKTQTAPAIGMDQLATTISDVDFAPNPRVKGDFTYVPESRELVFEVKSSSTDLNGVKAKAVDLAKERAMGEEFVEKGKAVFRNYATTQEKATYRVFFGMPWNYIDCEVYRPALSFGALTKLNLRHIIPVESFTTVARDCTTGCYYLSKTFNSCKQLHEFQTLDDFVKGKTKRTVNLELALDGWYIAAKNGMLYHNVSGTNTVAITDLGTGKTMGACQIPCASCRNGTGTFSHRGYTDIAVFLDERTEKVFAMYETEDAAEFKISEVLEGEKHKPQLGGTWVIKGERKGNYAYGFVYGNVVYLGTHHKQILFDRQYDLADCRLSSTSMTQPAPVMQAVDVHFTGFMPADRTFIACMSEPYRISIYEMAP